MKILIISPFFPYPPDNGGAIRIFSLIKHLSKQHEITLFSYINEVQRPLENKLRPYCQVVTLPIHHQKRSWIYHAGYFLAKLPYSLVYIDPRFKEELIRLSEKNFDIVQFEFLPFAHYVGYIEGSSKILVEHYLAVESRQRFIKFTKNPLLRLYYSMDLKKIAQFEKKIIQKFDKCIVTSEAHKELIQQMVPQQDCAVVENGVDLDFYSAPSTKNFKPYELSFMGSFGLDPANFDGISLFVEKIFPIVRSWYPDTTLNIIGTGLKPGERKQLKYPGVRISGRVDDIRPQISNSHVFIMPIRGGSGTKIRIPTVMAIGRPIVATRAACEGLKVNNDHNLLMADEPESFAFCIKRLFEDENLCNRLTDKARNLVGRHYDWSRSAQKAQNIYQTLRKKRRGN